MTTSREGFFVPAATERQILDASDIRRAVSASRMKSSNATAASGNLVMVGIYTRGVPLAQRLAAEIARIEGDEDPGRRAGYLAASR